MFKFGSSKSFKTLLLKSFIVCIYKPYMSILMFLKFTNNKILLFEFNYGMYRFSKHYMCKLKYLLRNELKIKSSNN